MTASANALLTTQRENGYKVADVGLKFRRNFRLAEECENSAYRMSVSLKGGDPPVLHVRVSIATAPVSKGFTLGLCDRPTSRHPSSSGGAATFRAFEGPASTALSRAHAHSESLTVLAPCGARLSPTERVLPGLPCRLATMV